MTVVAEFLVLFCVLCAVVYLGDTRWEQRRAARREKGRQL